jgi:hypothetical protein
MFETRNGPTQEVAHQPGFSRAKFWDGHNSIAQINPEHDAVLNKLICMNSLSKA